MNSVDRAWWLLGPERRQQLWGPHGINRPSMAARSTSSQRHPATQTGLQLEGIKDVVCPVVWWHGVHGTPPDEPQTGEGGLNLLTLGPVPASVGLVL